MSAGVTIYPQTGNPYSDIIFSEYNTSLATDGTISGSRANLRKYNKVKVYGLTTHANVLLQIFVNFVGTDNHVQWIQLTSGSTVANTLTGSIQEGLPFMYAQLYNTNAARQSGSLWYVGLY